MNEEFLLIVGLGNPGKEYSLTRHNIGFTLVGMLSSYLKATTPKEKFNSYLYNANAFNKKVILLKPLTYMNLSGNAVKYAGSIKYILLLYPFLNN